MQPIDRKFLAMIMMTLAAPGLILSACQDHKSGHAGHEASHGQSAETPPNKAAALAPAEGASVKILSPRTGQVFKADSIPLEFELIKGKRGEHVHAFVDGEMVGMFKTTKGTLTGVKPGNHTLEVRVVTADHNTELDATDKVQFAVQ
jgi:hypothetical protein